MSRCDEGYLCDVCGQDVASITDSDLYLRYILGEVPLERLHLEKERHISCNPALAQYIVDSGFTPILCTTWFAKEHLKAEIVAQEELKVTQAWRRLQLLPTLGLTIPEYPIPSPDE